MRYFGERDREIQRERERDRDGSDVTIVALKLAMNLHFPIPKFAQLAMSLHFPLPKIRTFRFSLHTSVSPFTRPRGHHCGAEIRNEFIHTFHCQNLFRPLCSPVRLSNGTSRATSDRKPKTNDQILPCPILFFPSKK